MSKTNREDIDRKMIVGALAHLREEWQAGTDGSLVDIEASIGLLLMYISQLLGLDNTEQVAVLGHSLHCEISRELKAL